MQRYRAVLSALGVVLVFLVGALVVAASARQSFAESQTAAPSKELTKTKTTAVTPATHPQIDVARQKCGDCHDAEAKQWDQSRHATGGAPCLVCHGAVDDNFVPKPALQRCQGCHAAIVEAMMTRARTSKVNVCFTCHQPHTLKMKRANVKRPHPNVGIGGTQ
jgi:ABC-type nickel/cobalt efflux system permease component RcnA